MMELPPGLPLLLNEVRGVVLADEGEAMVVVDGTPVDCDDGVADGARLRGSTTTAKREGVCERDAVFEVECREAGLEVRELLRKSSIGISSELCLQMNYIYY